MLSCHRLPYFPAVLRASRIIFLSYFPLRLSCRSFVVGVSSAFQQLLVVQSVRPERLHSAMSNFVCELLNVKSLSPPPLNLQRVRRNVPSHYPKQSERQGARREGERGGAERETESEEGGREGERGESSEERSLE